MLRLNNMYLYKKDFSSKRRKRGRVFGIGRRLFNHPARTSCQFEVLACYNLFDFFPSHLSSVIVN